MKNMKLVGNHWDNVLDCEYHKDYFKRIVAFINKEYQEANKLLKLEEKEIPADIDYDKIKNLASEARQKLKLVRPLTLAQASRISGVNPVDISVLAVYLKKEYNK